MPTHIDISTFIKKIATGNIKGAAKTILKSNWIALTCAKACPVDVLCEGACVYNEGGEETIQIGRLQRYAWIGISITGCRHSSLLHRRTESRSV